LGNWNKKVEKALKESEEEQKRLNDGSYMREMVRTY